MQRYDISSVIGYESSDGLYSEVVATPDSDGEWVRYEDAAKRIIELEAENARLGGTEWRDMNGLPATCQRATLRVGGDAAEPAEARSKSGETIGPRIITVT